MPNSSAPPNISFPERFQAIVFDWDGTAVTDRNESCDELARVLSKVLKQVPCVIVTGTSLPKIQGQCIDLIDPSAKTDLFVCANRGSEIFGFDQEGRSKVIFRRIATEEENAALDRAANLFRERAAAQGLEVGIVRDRLNRRKLDLIPTERWKDPRKSEARELLVAVQERFRSTGRSITLPNLVQVAEKCAHEAGLGSATITSDIKHIEIGLTSKSDSMRWTAEVLLKRRGIDPRAVLVVGDEFGSLGGVSGSDAFLRIPELQSATYVSVGLEPEGTPDWVFRLGGGPIRFRELLERQLQFEPILLGRVDPDPSWSLEQEGFDPSRERDLEALFTVGNGYLGIRGSLSVPIPSSQTDVFIAGIYDQKIRSFPYSEIEFMEPDGPGERTDPYTEIVPFPSPFELVLSMDGNEMTLEKSDHGAFKRLLDFKGAELHEALKWDVSEGRRLSVNVVRVACLGSPHLLVQEVELEVQGAGPLRLQVSPKLLGTDLVTKHVHLKTLEASELSSGAVFALMETFRSKFRIAVGCRTWLGPEGPEISGSRVELNLVPGKPARILRVIAIHSSRENAEPLIALKSTLKRLSPSLVHQEVEAHRERWRAYWQLADIRFLNHPELTEAQRFNSFQLRVAANEDPKTGMGARALSGRAYEGHVFWDTEIFTQPFLLHVAPILARANLDYRYHTLDGARRRARAMGYSGACYAWESTVTGDDVTPSRLLMKSSGKAVPVFTGAQQIHVTADVAYAISKYWEKTGDTEWMVQRGLEILVETARFWVSRVTRDRERFHIRRVVGPDEYHHDVDDNVYTNWMARLNLNAAVEGCRKLAELATSVWPSLKKRLLLRSEELEVWSAVARGMYISPPNGEGVIEQFSGYFNLKPVPRRQVEELKAPLDRLLEWEKVNGGQLIKQADLLMIPFLFPDAFPKEIVEANYRYYEPKTDHGSSLSPGVHAAIAAQIGKWEDAERFWKTGLQLDLLNLMRNTALGIHPGNMGGTWQALMFHILEGRVRERFLMEYGPIELQSGDRAVTMKGAA